jgi:hypothetical protein
MCVGKIEKVQSYDVVRLLKGSYFLAYALDFNLSHIFCLSICY